MRTVIAIFVTMTTVSMAAAELKLTVTVMTFNIRYDNPRDGINRWSNRRALAGDVVKKSKADFIGMQEAMPHQITQLAKDLSDYRNVGRSREADITKGEACPIFYRHARWILVESTTEWLSDTPAKPGSKSWGNGLPRIVTWAKFKERGSGRPIIVFNTHFDHRSQKSREKSAAMIAKRISAVDAKIPVVLTGDFNAAPNNAAIKTLTKSGLVDSYFLKHPNAKQVGTFNGWRGRTTGAKIDAVFVRSADKPKTTAATIIHTHREKVYPSDHFPVSATLKFSGE